MAIPELLEPTMVIPHPAIGSQTSSISNRKPSALTARAITCKNKGEGHSYRQWQCGKVAVTVNSVQELGCYGVVGITTNAGQKRKNKSAADLIQ